jgi:hypothetical protein
VVSLAAPGRLAVDGAAASARARLQTPPLGTPAAEVVRVRDLGAVVAEARWAAEPLTAELVRGHRLVVEAVFAERAVLPAPPGALFRSRAALSAWMELHAASLAEGLRFVEDRAEARVTARSDAGAPPDDAAASDEVARAAELFTALRREAVAHLVLRRRRRRGGGPRAHAGRRRAGRPADRHGGGARRRGARRLPRRPEPLGGVRRRGGARGAAAPRAAPRVRRPVAAVQLRAARLRGLTARAAPR